MIAPLTWPDGTPHLHHHNRHHPAPLPSSAADHPTSLPGIAALPKEVQRELETQLLQLRDQLEATGKPREWVAAQLSEQRRSLEAAARDALASAAAAAAAAPSKKGEKGESSRQRRRGSSPPDNPADPARAARLRAG